MYTHTYTYTHMCTFCSVTGAGIKQLLRHRNATFTVVVDDMPGLPNDTRVKREFEPEE